MKAVILAGGVGSRLSEETLLRPKPLVEIGGRPILWHIMKGFAAQGVKEFVVALGYRGEMIKRYFLQLGSMSNDLSIDLGRNEVTVHEGECYDWLVHLVDTGAETETGGRLRRLRTWLEGESEFLFTYGDGLADVDLKRLVDFHRTHGKLATVTSVRSPARFGRLSFEGDRIVDFYEKPESGEGWINGGYFVLDPRVLDLVDSDQTVWERDPVERLCRDGQLQGFRHHGFWSCMDTLKEKRILEEIWASGRAPWKTWV